MDSLTNAFGRTVVPVQLPIGSEKSFTGVIDLVKMKAYTYDMGGNGKAKVGDIPANMAEEAKAAHETPGRAGCRRRRRADGRVLREGHHRRRAHRRAAFITRFAKTRSFPVLFASGLGNMGTDEVLDFIVEYMPTATEHRDGAAASERQKRQRQRASHHDDPSRSRCTCSRRSAIRLPGASRSSRSSRGVLKNDATVQNFTRSTSEKFAHLSTMQGKTPVPVPELHAGDIGAVAKLRDTLPAIRWATSRRRFSIRRSRLAGAGDHVCDRAEVARRRRQARRTAFTS